MNVSKNYLSVLCMLAACLFIISCGHSHEGGADHSHDTSEKTEAAHKGHDHAGHNHSGHDHSGHNHAGHDHSGHDHSGHDHAGHDHSGHDHSSHDQASKEKKAGPVGHTNRGKEYDSVYVCPMHCKNSGGDKAGTCLACKMDYVKITDHIKDGHIH